MNERTSTPLLADGHSARPVFAAVAAVAVLSAMDALIKAVGEHHGTAQVVMLRYAFGFVTVAAFLMASGARRPSRGTFKRAGIRVGFTLGTAFLFFKTLTLLPLAEAVAITFTAPFFMLVASRVLLKEAMPPRSLLAIGIGFAGVLVMVAGRTGMEAGHGPWLGYATGLGCSVTYAMSMVLMRRDTGHDPVVALVFAQNAAAFVASIPFGAVTWTAPTGLTLGLFAAAGVLGTAGHLFFAWAYSRSPASRLAPLEYTAFLWAAVFGVVFFGEVPSPWTLAGAALIVGACLMVFGRPAADAA
jgi:drug/metabolite transporter (DMT)-like permease